MKTQGNPRTLGDIVRARIEHLGVSDVAVARKIGTSSSMITLVSRNARPVPIAALDDWIKALEIDDHAELVEFIQLVRRSHKQGLEAVFAEYEREIAHLQRQIQSLQDGQKADSDDITESMRDAINPGTAIPWKSGPKSQVSGITIGHGQFLPVSCRTGKPVDAVYTLVLYDSCNRMIGQDVGICLGIAQIEQRARRLLKRTAKGNLPSGWYGLRIRLLAVRSISATQLWAISCPDGEVLRTPMDHDDR